MCFEVIVSMSVFVRNVISRSSIIWMWFQCGRQSVCRQCLPSRCDTISSLSLRNLFARNILDPVRFEIEPSFICFQTFSPSVVIHSSRSCCTSHKSFSWSLSPESTCVFTPSWLHVPMNNPIKILQLRTICTTSRGGTHHHTLSPSPG